MQQKEQEAPNLLGKMRTWGLHFTGIPKTLRYQVQLDASEIDEIQACKGL